MSKRTWKDALAGVYFEWQTRSLLQPSRAPGWNLAAEITIKFFSKNRSGVSWSLVGLALPKFLGEGGSITGYGKYDNLYDLLVDLAAEIMKARDHTSYGFDDPNFALSLASSDVINIAKNYACNHMWKSVYGGGYVGPNGGEPPWEGRQCVKCNLESGEPLEDLSTFTPIEIPTGFSI